MTSKTKRDKQYQYAKEAQAMKLAEEEDAK